MIDLDGLFTIKLLSGSSGAFESIGTVPTTITAGMDFEYEATYVAGGTMRLNEVNIKFSA